MKSSEEIACIDYIHDVLTKNGFYEDERELSSKFYEDFSFDPENMMIITTKYEDGSRSWKLEESYETISYMNEDQILEKFQNYALI